MSTKIKNGVVLIYAVIISFLLLFFSGVAVAAKESALSPLDYLSIKTISQVIEENTFPVT